MSRSAGAVPSPLSRVCFAKQKEATTQECEESSSSTQLASCVLAKNSNVSESRDDSNQPASCILASNSSSRELLGFTIVVAVVSKLHTGTQGWGTAGRQRSRKAPGGHAFVD